MPLISPNVYKTLDACNYTREERVRVLTEFNRLCAERGFTGEDCIVLDQDAIVLLNLSAQILHRILGGDG